MDNIMRLLILSLCGLVAGEPLGRLLQRRRDALEEYARDYAPYMFAAFPLHAPVPVLRVLTRAPLAPRPAPAALPYSAPARDYPEPSRSYAGLPQSYAAAEPEYEASSYSYARDYARPAPAYHKRLRRPVAPAPSYEYAAEYDAPAAQRPPARPAPSPQLTFAIAPYDSVAYSASQEAAPTVLYARPSPSGGFTYRRVPGASAPPPRRTPPPTAVSEREKDPPFIVKIHKYRIVKDDLI